MMRPRALLLAGLLALLAAPAWAQSPAVSRARLPNGLTVLVRENPTAPVVGISLMVRMGTRWETADNAGISNLVQLMIIRGTTTRDGGQIVAAADAMGGSIEATGDVDFSEVAATALSRHWVEMLELVADVALRPTMPDGVVTAVRDFLLRQVRNRGDKPYDVALDALTAPDLRPPPLRLGSDRPQGEPRAARPRRAARPLQAALRAGRPRARGERPREDARGDGAGHAALRTAARGRRADRGPTAAPRPGPLA